MSQVIETKNDKVNKKQAATHMHVCAHRRIHAELSHHMVNSETHLSNERGMEEGGGTGGP